MTTDEIHDQADAAERERIAELQAEVCCPNASYAASVYCGCGGRAAEELARIRAEAARAEA